MRAYASSALIALFGMIVLTDMTFGVTQKSRRVAAVVNLWESDGLKRAAATGLTIIDSHWNNRIIVFDMGGDATALTRLSDQGFWLLDATGTTLCDNALTGA